MTNNKMPCESAPDQIDENAVVSTPLPNTTFFCITIYFSNYQKTFWFNGNKRIYKNVFVIAPGKNISEDELITFQAGTNNYYPTGVIKHLFDNIVRYKEYIQSNLSD